MIPSLCATDILEVLFVAYIWSEKLKRWQGKTVDKKIVRLANNWFDLNVAWQFTDFYDKTLKPLKDNKRAKKGTRPLQPRKWYHLPVDHNMGATKLPVHIEHNVNSKTKFNVCRKIMVKCVFP